MAFIEKSDILKEIREEELNQITRNDDATINYGIDVAISEMKSYLITYYDVDVIFAQTGDNRHKLLLNFGVDIAIYVMVATALPGQDLEDRRARYKRAIDWLKMLQSGEVASDLPKIETDEQPNSRGAVKTHNKRCNYY